MLQKTSNDQAKKMDRDQKNLSGSIIAVKKAKRPFRLLLIDDLYSTGETITECAKILRQDQNLKKIYILTMTKTR